MITTSMHPERDTVLFDGQCRFCQSQVALLRCCDLWKGLHFRSLHDPEVAVDFPELSREELLSKMYVIDPSGRARGGADAVKYLSCKLPPLWPLAALLHIPGTMPIWTSLYAFVARNRYRIAGRMPGGGCDTGTCRIP